MQTATNRVLSGVMLVLCLLLGSATPAVGQWQNSVVDPNDIYYNKGDVGIWTTDPKWRLHVVDARTASGTRAIMGLASDPNTSNLTYGMYGQSNSHGGVGMLGWAAATSGRNYGVWGLSSSNAGIGVYAKASSGTGVNCAVLGETSSASGFASYFQGGRNYFSGRVGIGTDDKPEKLAVLGTIRSYSGGFVFPDGSTQTKAWPGDGGDSWLKNGNDIYHQGSRVLVGATSPHFAYPTMSIQVDHSFLSGQGLEVYGGQQGDEGIRTEGGYHGIYTRSRDADGSAIYAVCENKNTAWAGYFYGRVYVDGWLEKHGGGFKNDHPLDPANKYLNHSFVESPDMKNLYDGVAVLDSDGCAVVEMPAYFEIVNKDFRYQLTCIGAFAQVFIAQELKDRRFVIAGGTAGMKVSWQVTGTRCDVWANANRMVVEPDKQGVEKGTYLDPDLYGEPSELGLHRVLDHGRAPRLEEADSSVASGRE